jgi:predicted metal-binding membrane protein
MGDAVSAAGAGLPRRDRVAILTGLGGVTLLAWIYLVYTAKRMTDMPGMPVMPDMPEMVMLRTWAAADFLFMFLMWAIMMVGMMAPAAAPMTLLYAAIARRAAGQNNPIPPATVFVAGYIAMWTFFSAAATLMQWALERAALLSSMMVSTSPMLGAGILIVAGVYQFTPLKASCLRHCRTPAAFFSERWRTGFTGAFQMGLVYGAYCLGCCGFLMLLLFVGGVMNLLWIAAIAILILAEKASPLALRGGRIAGFAMIVLGVLAIIRFSL